MQDAAAHHEFILVSPAGASRVNITDSQALWMKNPSVVFQTGYRIAGTPQDITTDLTSQQIPLANIQELLNSSISNINYGGDWAPIYQKEVNDYLQYQRSATAANINQPGTRLLDILMAVNPRFTDQFKTQAQARALGVNVTKARAVRGAGGPAPGALARRIDTLAEGKVMDVSDLEPDGKGARTIAATTASKQQKYGTQTLRIVSYDMPHYELAISMLPNGMVQYQQELVAMRDFFAANPPVPRGEIIQIGAVPAPGVAAVIPPPIISPRTTGRGPIVRNPALPAVQIPAARVETVPALFTKAQKKRMAKAAALLPVPPPPIINVPVPQPGVPVGLPPGIPPPTIPLPTVKVPLPTVKAPLPVVQVPLPVVQAPLLVETLEYEDLQSEDEDDNSDSDFDDTPEGFVAGPGGYYQEEED